MMGLGMRQKSIVLVVVPLGIFLTNCGVSGSSADGSTPGVTITPQPISVAVNSATTFNSTGTNALTKTMWSFVTPVGSAGTISAVNADPMVYTAPASPPVYADPRPSVQGIVTLQAAIAGVGSSNVSFYVTAPAITVGLSPASATVPLGGMLQFYGYAVGGVNNGVVFAVNGVPGGSAALGTISTNGLYTAPASMPMSGATVTLTASSAADASKSAAAVVTLR